MGGRVAERGGTGGSRLVTIGISHSASGAGVPEGDDRPAATGDCPAWAAMPDADGGRRASEGRKRGTALECHHLER